MFGNLLGLSLDKKKYNIDDKYFASPVLILKKLVV